MTITITTSKTAIKDGADYKKIPKTIYNIEARNLGSENIIQEVTK